MVDVHLLFGISPYECSNDEDEDEDSCPLCKKETKGLVYMYKHPLLHLDYENSHDDDCSCTECKEHGPERFECLLCDRDDMTKQAVEYHCGEDTHKANLKVLKREQHEALDVIYRWNLVHEMPDCKRLQGADRLALSDDVLAAAYRFTAAKSEKEKKKHTIGKVVSLMHKYEFGERLALLSLAVWKVECMSKMPVTSDYLAAQTWFSSGWKSHKLKNRKSKTMTTIVSLVLPFLKNPKPKSQKKRQK
jgi:hypothetical protein